MSAMSFFTADTLGMELSGAGDDHLTGNITKVASCRPYRVEFTQVAISDVITPKEAGFWVVMSPTLWFYLVVREKDSFLFVFDAAACGIKPATAYQFGGISVKDTLIHIKSFVKASFQWSGVWQRKDINLEKLVSKC